MCVYQQIYKILNSSNVKESISTTWFYSVGNWLWNSVYSNYRKLHLINGDITHYLIDDMYTTVQVTCLSMHFFLYIIDTTYILSF